MLSGCEMEIVNLNDWQQFREVQSFLGQFGLTFDRGAEYTINFRRDGKIAGTGSFTGEVLHNIAVDKTLQGMGVVATIVSELMQELARRGRFHYFIFTKPCISHVFERLGFIEIARAEPYVSLLETGIGSVSAYCDQMNKQMAHLKGDRAAVVVGGNPLAHEHWSLIGQAAKENDAVIVLVTNEDPSFFPFADRLRLVREGIADLDNVMVVSADKYILSSAAFPTYFIRIEDQLVSQMRLDVNLFATQIAPRLGIKTRYAWEEPACLFTGVYNRAMLDILPAYGIDIRIVKRVDRSLVSTG